MKIEKLNKDNIKDFINDMKLDENDNLMNNIGKIEFYGVKKDDVFLIGFNLLSSVDTIAIMNYNPKLSNELFYDCIEFLDKSLVVNNHLIVEVFCDKYIKLLEDRYKCKELDVILGTVDEIDNYIDRNLNVKEKFVDIEMKSIKYNLYKGNIICNFVKQNVYDEKLILELHNFFSNLEVNYILYTIYEENFEYLKTLGYGYLCKRFIIKN